MALVIGTFIGDIIATKRERKFFDMYQCFNACKYRNDPNFVLPISIDDLLPNTTKKKPIDTKFPKNMTYEEFKKGFELKG